MRILHELLLDSWLREFVVRQAELHTSDSPVLLHLQSAQIYPHIVPHWHQIGQISDFLTYFGAVQKTDLKKSEISPIWFYSDPIEAKPVRAIRH